MAPGCVETKEVCAAAPICVTVKVAIFAVAAVWRTLGRPECEPRWAWRRSRTLLARTLVELWGSGRVGDKLRTAGFGLAID